MKRIVIAVAASWLLAGAASAQTPTSIVTFTAVDAVDAQPLKIVIAGVKDGETVASSQEIVCASTTDGTCSALLQNCARIALLAMTKPGQYMLKVGLYFGTKPYSCKLERVAP